MPFSVVGFHRFDPAREKRNNFDLTNRKIRRTPLKRDNFIKRRRIQRALLVGSPNWNIISMHFHAALDCVDRFRFSARLVHSCYPFLIVFRFLYDIRSATLVPYVRHSIITTYRSNECIDETKQNVIH